MVEYTMSVRDSNITSITVCHSDYTRESIDVSDYYWEKHSSNSDDAATESAPGAGHDAL